jgi:hypothetical protein
MARITSIVIKSVDAIQYKRVPVDVQVQRVTRLWPAGSDEELGRADFQVKTA